MTLFQMKNFLIKEIKIIIIILGKGIIKVNKIKIVTSKPNRIIHKNPIIIIIIMDIQNKIKISNQINVSTYSIKMKTVKKKLN